MKLTDIVREVRKDERTKEVFITKRQVDVIINVFIEKVKDALYLEGEAKIHNLFTLQFKQSKGKRIRTIQNEEMITSDYTRIKVKPSIDLKETMKKYTHKLDN
ncbi:HU family DNA-binding protein [Enterococcus casseliflavus]|uniref:HU family DNA-binding protein n=1 Tax=Enterococcus casseliflavus TaxID=37734 RepID=UPI00301B464F